MFFLKNCVFASAIFVTERSCGGVKIGKSDSSFCATFWCSVNCEDWSPLRRN